MNEIEVIEDLETLNKVGPSVETVVPVGHSFYLLTADALYSWTPRAREIPYNVHLERRAFASLDS